MIAALRRRLTTPRVGIPLAAALLALSGALTFSHARAIADVSRIALPLSAELPKLTARLEVLKEHVELSELRKSVQVSSPEELVHVYVLPEEQAVERLLDTLDAVHDALRGAGELRSVSAIDIGAAETEGDLSAGQAGATVTPVAYALTVTDDGLKDILTFFDVAGSVTVGDVLPADDIAMLSRLTEQENPAGIVSLEQLLGTDALRYSLEPRPYDEQIERSFSQGLFMTALRESLNQPAVRATRELLGGDVGKALRDGGLWPVRFMTIDGLHVENVENGLWEVEISLMAHGRK